MSARAVIIGGRWIVIAGIGIHASRNFGVVAHRISVDIGSAGSTTNTNGVQLVTVTVTIANRDPSATTVVNRTGSITQPASIIFTHAVVNIVADAVRVGIRCAVSAAIADRVHLIAVAVTIPCRDAGATTIAAGVNILAIDIVGVIVVARGEVGTSVIGLTNTVAIQIGLARAALGLLPDRLTKPLGIEGDVRPEIRFIEAGVPDQYFVPEEKLKGHGAAQGP